jgi:hypothetical protein
MQRRKNTIASCGRRLVSLDLPRRSSTKIDELESDTHSHPNTRLWAATGQAALESARLLVIGGTATATSTLKNLVLPGIGHFTVLDPHDVAPEDVGNNFFLEVESVGRAKAVETSRWLAELNDSVDSAAEVNVRPSLPELHPVFACLFGGLTGRCQRWCCRTLRIS